MNRINTTTILTGLENLPTKEKALWKAEELLKKWEKSEKAVTDLRKKLEAAERDLWEVEGNPYYMKAADIETLRQEIQDLNVFATEVTKILTDRTQGSRGNLRKVICFSSNFITLYSSDISYRDSPISPMVSNSRLLRESAAAPSPTYAQVPRETDLALKPNELLDNLNFAELCSRSVLPHPNSSSRTTRLRRSSDVAGDAMEVRAGGGTTAGEGGARTEGDKNMRTKRLRSCKNSSLIIMQVIRV